MNPHELLTSAVSDIPHGCFGVSNHVTIVARDKKLRSVLAHQIRNTDYIVAVVSRKQAAKGFDTPFWQCIINKISQLQQEGSIDPSRNQN